MASLKRCDGQPNLVVLAGPNGAGKSTAASAILRGALGITEFVNADVIAQGLSAFTPEKVAIQAGRVMLARLKSLAADRENFAFETTLASRGFASWIEGLVAEGYAFHLQFFWLPSADMAVARVASRVKSGGHSVPEDVIRRRYLRGIHNFFELYSPLATTWNLYNGLSSPPELIAEGGSGREINVQNQSLWAIILKQA